MNENKETSYEGIKTVCIWACGIVIGIIDLVWIINAKEYIDIVELLIASIIVPIGISMSISFILATLVSFRPVALMTLNCVLSIILVLMLNIIMVSLLGSDTLSAIIAAAAVSATSISVQPASVSGIIQGIVLTMVLSALMTKLGIKVSRTKNALHHPLIDEYDSENTN
jgi:hypothetical protein